MEWLNLPVESILQLQINAIDYNQEIIDDEQGLTYRYCTKTLK